MIVCVNKHKELYFKKKVDGHTVVCYSKDKENRDTNWQIALPEYMLKSTIKWYHIVMGHPGSKKLKLTLQQQYHHPELEGI